MVRCVAALRLLVIGLEDRLQAQVVARASEEPEIEAVVAVRTVDAAIPALRALRPTVVLIRSDGFDEAGEATIEALLELPAPAPIVMITEHNDIASLRLAIHAGARAFVPTTTPANELLDVIRHVHAGGSSVPPQVLGVILEDLFAPDQQPLSAPLDRLTIRQVEVLGLLVDGRDPEAIAEALHLSIHTVRTHIKEILRRLGVHSSLEAVAVALRSGLGPRRIS